MGKRLGIDNYQYEAVEDWLGIDIPGIASDVATDSQDRVYVATRTASSFDNRSGAILVLDRDGRFLKSFGDDKLRGPHHIWISPDDEIYLADSWDHVVRRYNTGGEMLQVIGTPGSSPECRTSPSTSPPAPCARRNQGTFMWRMATGSAASTGSAPRAS